MPRSPVRETLERHYPMWLERSFDDESLAPELRDAVGYAGDVLINTGVRIHYVVRQAWNADCLVPDKMQTAPQDCDIAGLVIRLPGLS